MDEISFDEEDNYIDWTEEQYVLQHQRDLELDQLWFWSKEWQDGEAQVDKYIAKGEVQSFDTMEEFLNTLEK